MQYQDYKKAIRNISREIEPQAIAEARELIGAQLSLAPFDGVSIQRDVAYGAHAKQRLDIFTPVQPDPVRPLLIFIHGGGFVMGDKHTPDSPFYDNIGHWAVNHGLNAINMTYRLAPEFSYPSGIEDVRAVIELVQQQGAQHGISADNIFLMGQSAGGAHASIYLTHPQHYENRPHGLKGIILISGIYDFSDVVEGNFDQAYIGTDTSLYAERSSLAGLAGTDLPMLVSISERDPVRFQQQGLNLLSAYHQQHQRFPQFVFLNAQNHISPVMYLGLDGDELGTRIVSFIEDHC